MTTLELKKMLNDYDNTEKLLHKIGCHSIKRHDGYITCANVDGDNASAIVIYLSEFMKVMNYTRKEFDESSDIFDLVRHNLKVMGKSHSFYDSIVFIHKVFGLKLDNSYVPKKDKAKKDILEVFTKAKKIAKNTYEDYEYDIEYNENFDYVRYPHIDFFREGLTLQTVNKFALGYNNYSKRTVIPMRYWLNGRVLGYNMRSSIKNCEELGIRKYYISKGYHKGINLYGLWENREHIEKAERIVIFEAEKSVLKRDALDDCTCVALSGHTMTKEQISIILGLNVKEVIIAMDNDIDVNEVRSLCHNFYGLRKVSYIKDNEGLLGKKDSPCDKGNVIYTKLFNNRITYDCLEESKYQNFMRDK